MQPTFAGVRVTHPERVIFPAEGLTELDLVVAGSKKGPERKPWPFLIPDT
jgi:hypothetical protein